MEFKLPELGEGVHEGELVKWRVNVGDVVKHDQPVCDVMTDKATIEIPASFDGKILSLGGKEGQIVKVGQTLVSFEAEGGGHAVAVPSAPAPVSLAAKPAAAVVMSGATSDGAPMVLASPATRRMAREMNVDLSRVSGSGPHGRVLKEDLQKGVISSPAPARAPLPTYTHLAAPAGGEKRIPVMGLRKKIVEKMRQSEDHTVPFTFVEEADATDLVRLRTEAKAMGERQGIKVTYLPFLMKAMVVALREFPMVNSSLDETTNEIVLKNYFNIGLSIQTNDGLTAPVVKDVEHKSVLQLAKEIQELVERARANKLTMNDFQNSTITLTNAGNIGGLFATPVINYPEVAILGFNKIFRKPVVKLVNGQEQIVIRDWTYFSATFDHRVVDGAIGAEFVKRFIQIVENPALLLLDPL